MLAIKDRLQRPIHDLRISVTDRCNFRCSYCMPKEIFGEDYAFLPPSELLTFEELERLTRLFVSIGVRKIRLTGGEPLMRPRLPELVKKITQLDGVKDIGLTTNGVMLGKQAGALHDAGLRRLNVSLDAMDPELFMKMNNRGVRPERVLDSIEQAVDKGFDVKVNMVVQKGVNDGEIEPMAAYFKERGITLRFIEFMDVGNGNGWSFEQVTPMKDILNRLQNVYRLEPVDENYFGEVAKRYRYLDNGAEVGFITSVSQSFCSTCTRARLSSDGKLYTCLFASKGFDLRDLIRRGASDEELLAAIINVWENRSDRYSEERTEETARNKPKIDMSYIGG